MKRWSLDARFFAVLTFVFVAFAQVERAFAYARHLEEPGFSVLIQYVILPCLMVYWLERDSHEREVGQVWRVWDMGFFLLVAWPVIIPYHLIKTRGIRRTSVILLLLTITYFGAFVIAAAFCRARQ